MHFCPAPGAPPGRAKKCTFFWVFNNSPSRDSLGHFFRPRAAPGHPREPPRNPPPGPGEAPRSSPRRTGSHYRTAPDAVCPAERDGALGRRPSDGYPLDGLTANGWYVAVGRAPPSRQGRKSAQHREVTRKEPAVCESQTRVATGVTGKVRKSTAGPENPPPSSRDPATPACPSGPPPAGHGRGRAERPRPWDTLPQAVDTPLPLIPPPTFNNY